MPPLVHSHHWRPAHRRGWSDSLRGAVALLIGSIAALSVSVTALTLAG